MERSETHSAFNCRRRRRRRRRTAAATCPPTATSPYESSTPPPCPHLHCPPTGLCREFYRLKAERGGTPEGRQRTAAARQHTQRLQQQVEGLLLGASSSSLEANLAAAAAPPPRLQQPQPQPQPQPAHGKKDGCAAGSHSSHQGGGTAIAAFRPAPHAPGDANQAAVSGSNSSSSRGGLSASRMQAVRALAARRAASRGATPSASSSSSGTAAAACSGASSGSVGRAVNAQIASSVAAMLLSTPPTGGAAAGGGARTMRAADLGAHSEEEEAVVDAAGAPVGVGMTPTPPDAAAAATMPPPPEVRQVPAAAWHERCRLPSAHPHHAAPSTLQEGYTPVFMSRKQRSLHCELDTPGRCVPGSWGGGQPGVGVGALPACPLTASALMHPPLPDACPPPCSCLPAGALPIHVHTLAAPAPACSASWLQCLAALCRRPAASPRRPRRGPVAAPVAAQRRPAARRCVLRRCDHAAMRCGQMRSHPSAPILSTLLLSLTPCTAPHYLCRRFR